MVDGIEEGSLVILHCGNPREKMWGLLVRLDGVGVVVRGLDLNSVEDWLRQEKIGRERMIGPTTFFLPMNRVLRIDLDESTTAVDSYGDRYRTACGREVRDALLDDGGIDA
jgi:hypothetical protein